ncbi:MAG: DUF2207 domain-containing protein, partial [Planctomycetota bacterium JB042]
LADERVLSFDAEVVVDARGGLTVTETIRVRVEGQQIRHGIFRDFPTTYPGSFGLDITVPFEVVSVTLDGRPEPYDASRRGNGVRVRIGSASRVVPPGEHVYVLRYETGRQLGIFDDHDELYWNVTGNDWVFPIAEAAATVRLPSTVPLEEVETRAFRGRQGSRDTDRIEATVDPEDGAIRFRTTSARHPLRPGEGLTIAVKFPKGHVVTPSFVDQALQDRVLPVGLVGFLLVLGYFLVAWKRVGVDPAKGTIIPEYEPPLGLSPAATRHVWRMGFDKECVGAALLGLAQRGAIEIDDDDGTITLRKRASARETGAPIGERKVLQALLGDRDSLELNNANHARVKKALDSLKVWLNEEHEGKLFLKNRRWLVPGVLLTIGALVAALFAGDFVVAGQSAFLVIWLSVWTLGVAILLSATVAAWRGSGLGSKGKAIFLSLFSLPFLAGELFGLFALMTIGSVWLGPLLVLLIGTNVVFFFLMKAPTGPGRRVMDRIEGLRMYLGTAEKDRLEASTRAAREPERTVQQFERFLPYAVALGVENSWAERFQDVLERATMPDGTAYRPTWYHGAFSAAHLGAFTSSVSSGLSSAISSSATPPGSSSGFSGGGGGGFSGGGGGGGGGGGW